MRAVRRILFLLCGCVLPVLADTLQYVYDDLGRLSKVIYPSGIQVEYHYDEVGNILQVTQSILSPVEIFDFSPPQGPIGTQVTLQGRGFSTTPGNNLVKFNGTAATVTASTTSSLKTLVPNGATTGPISVTVGGNTAVSAKVFKVSPNIASLTPNYAIPGLALTGVAVTGQNLNGASFRFLPELTPSAIAVTATTTAPNGASASLNLQVSANATLGNYVLVAKNAGGDSAHIGVARNSFRVLDPLGDDDGDGLSNAAEIAAGTNPLNRDTDGDGWLDGDELAVGTNPNSATSVPVLQAVAQPQVRLVVTQMLSDTSGILAQPPVRLVLPQLFMDTTSLIAKPEVRVVIPELTESAVGTTVAQPPVAVMLLP